MRACTCFNSDLQPATGRCAHCGNVIPPRTPAPEAPLGFILPNLAQPVGDATTVAHDGGFSLVQLPGIDWIPAFSVDPPGKLILTSHMSFNDKWTTIKHADPEVRFPDELLTNISSQFDPNINDPVVCPDMRLDRVKQHDTSCTCPPGHQCFTGWMLHIDGRDRHVVYQIGEWVPQDGLDRGAWIARWPD